MSFNLNQTMTNQPDEMKPISLDHGIETPWPVREILMRLCEATHHLLHDHDHDCDGHEGYAVALAEGRKVLAAPPAKDSQQGAAVKPDGDLLNLAHKIVSAFNQGVFRRSTLDDQASSVMCWTEEVLPERIANRERVRKIMDDHSARTKEAIQYRDQLETLKDENEQLRERVEALEAWIHNEPHKRICALVKAYKGVKGYGAESTCTCGLEALKGPQQ